MSEGIKVARVGDVEDEEGLKIDRSVLGTVDDVALFLDEGTYYALDNECTHEKADLADGWVEDGCVECPLHGAQFRLCDGAALTLPATVAEAVHQVIVDGDDILIVPNPDRLAK